MVASPLFSEPLCSSQVTILFKIVRARPKVVDRNPVSGCRLWKPQSQHRLRQGFPYDVNTEPASKIPFPDGHESIAVVDQMNADERKQEYENLLEHSFIDLFGKPGADLPADDNAGHGPGQGRQVGR